MLLHVDERKLVKNTKCSDCSQLHKSQKMIILYKNFTKSLKTTREGTKRSKKKKKKSYIAYVCHKKRQFLAKKKNATIQGKVHTFQSFTN